MEPAGFDSHSQVGCSDDEKYAVCNGSTKRHAEVLKNQRLAMETLTRRAVAEPPKVAELYQEKVAETIPIARKIMENNTPDDNGGIRWAKAR